MSAPSADSEAAREAAAAAPASPTLDHASTPSRSASKATLDTEDAPNPAGPYASGERDAKKGPDAHAVPAKGGTHDLFCIPIPRRLQWDPEHPPEFTLLLNVIFGFSATFTVANLYYPQSILISLAESFNVPYERVTNIPTLLQASYAIGLLFICPLGDLVRRRQLLLLLVLCSTFISLGLALVPSVEGFEVLSFFVGLVSVTPQVLLPLSGDLAHPDRRAAALSIVLAGLLLGLLCARVLAGSIAYYSQIANIYWMAFGLQAFIWAMLYASVPDYPAKNPDLRYIDILASMVKYACTEPVLVQGCLIAFAASAVFSCFWTTSTFLLGGVYGYNSFEIGLFGLVGIIGVGTAPFVGRGVDKLVPWVGVLVGLSLIGTSMAIYTGAAGLSVGVVIICIFLLDIGQQVQQVSNSTRIFAISTAARARLSAVYIFAIFCGQLVGTKAGTTVFLTAGGYRSSGAFCLGLVAWMLAVLFSRGPHLPIDRWLGHTGGWELRRGASDEAKAAAKEKGLKPEKAEIDV